MDTDRASRLRLARQRAIRAAQVVTVSAMMGCGMSHVNVNTDSGPEPEDSGTDAGTLADAGYCESEEEINASRECCEYRGGSWQSSGSEERCFWIVEGPRVPPAMSA